MAAFGGKTVLRPASRRLQGSSATAVGIELVRAYWKVEGYHSRPFGCEVGSQFRHGHVFRSPPIIPDGRVSPGPVGSLGLSRVSLPLRDEGQALVRIPPKHARFAHLFVSSLASAYSRLSVRAPRYPMTPPSTQSPFA